MRCQDNLDHQCSGNVYNFTDMRHHTNSCIVDYKHITDHKSYTVKKMKGCKADIQDFETKLTRGQYKNVCYMLEVYYNISKKLTMFTKSCRDAEEEYPPKFLKVLGEGSNWGKHAHIFTTIS